MLLQDKEQTEVGIGYERKLKEGCRDNSKQCSDPSTLFYQLKSCFSGNQWRKSARAVRFYFLPVSSWVQSWENCIIEHQQSKFFLTLSAYICVNAAATEKTQSCMIFWVIASSNRSRFRQCEKFLSGVWVPMKPHVESVLMASNRRHSPIDSGYCGGT